MIDNSHTPKSRSTSSDKFVKTSSLFLERFDNSDCILQRFRKNSLFRIKLPRKAKVPISQPEEDWSAQINTSVFQSQKNIKTKASQRIMLSNMLDFKKQKKSIISKNRQEKCKNSYKLPQILYQKSQNRNHSHLQTLKTYLHKQLGHKVNTHSCHTRRLDLSQFSRKKQKSMQLKLKNSCIYPENSNSKCFDQSEAGCFNKNSTVTFRKRKFNNSKVLQHSSHLKSNKIALDQQRISSTKKQQQQCFCQVREFLQANYFQTVNDNKENFAFQLRRGEMTSGFSMQSEKQQSDSFDFVPKMFLKKLALTQLTKYSSLRAG